MEEWIRHVDTQHKTLPLIHLGEPGARGQTLAGADTVPVRGRHVPPPFLSFLLAGPKASSRAVRQWSLGWRLTPFLRSITEKKLISMVWKTREGNRTGVFLLTDSV